MTWNCPFCETSNPLAAATCRQCSGTRPLGASAWSYVSAGPSLFLIAALLTSAAYGRSLYLGRASARAEVEAGSRRQAVLQQDLTKLRAETDRTRAELSRIQQNLGLTTTRLAEADAERTQLARALGELQALVASQTERLARRPRSATKAVNVENRCSSQVRAAIRFRQENGIWMTYAFWEFPPGMKDPLRVRDVAGRTVDARVTWSLTYVYAETADRSWVYQGVNNEVETVRDGNRVLTMKSWNLSVDNEDNYVLILCS